MVDNNFDILVDGRSLGNYYGLQAEQVNIESPSVKKVTKKIPGRDGVLDLTDWPLGRPSYNNRKVQIVCSSVGGYDNWLAFMSDVNNFLHGSVHKIVFVTDSDFYWRGRLGTSHSKSDDGYNSVTITGDVEPYKYKHQETVANFTVSGAADVSFDNLFRPVIPTITTSAPFRILFGGNTYDVSAGTMQIAGIEFSAGSNALTLQGTGTITFTYQEASL